MKTNTYLPSMSTVLSAASIIASAVPKLKGSYLGLSCMALGFTSLSQNIINSYREGELISRRTLVDCTVSVAAIAVGYVQLSTDFYTDRYDEGYDAGYYAGHKAGTLSEREKWLDL